MRFLLLLTTLLTGGTLFAQPLLGRTTGRLPYLNYGLGEDRLGGAKMTYLDSAVLLNVVDSTPAAYKVQLSKMHAAYLPKQFFKRDTSRQQPATYLTGSWRVWGDDRYDYVSVALPEKLPYHSVQEIDPARIVVDVFGATTNTNWITQLKTAREIKNVWYQQVEDDVFRIYIGLKHRQHWGYSIGYKNNLLQIRVKRQPEMLHIKNLRIAIDAGHGGSNSGAAGRTTGIAEKDYTLKMAGCLAAYLCKKGAAVYTTRCNDADLGMEDRLLELRRQDPDLLISIHLNSSGNPAVKGTSTYYRYIGFRSLSQSILDRMLGLGLNNFGNVGAFNFSLNGPTEYPNCLVEVAFLSNEEDEKRILDERFHQAVAKKIYKGIKDWLKGLK